MSNIGFLFIILTTLVFTIIGLLYSRKKHLSLEDFITSRKSIGLSTGIFTLIASAMGAWILFSPAETTVRTGIMSLLGYAVGSAAALWIFAWIGARLRKLMPQGHTLTEFVLHRYGRMMYIFVLIIMFFYMIVFLSAELTGIALAANFTFGIPLVFTAVIIGFGTLIYTALGGIKTTVFTDTIQSIVILPLLALIFISSLFFLNGFDLVDKAIAISPELFDFNFKLGIESGIALMIAIVGANLFHQGYWQRVYLPKTNRIMQNSFIISGIFVVFIILAAGFFGFFAIGVEAAENPSVAMFTFLIEAVPPWMLILGMVLAVALVMSSVDTLLNGLVGLLTIDVLRLKPKLDKNKVLSGARWLTVIIAGIAILVATQGLSVLYLFFVADFVCVAASFPTFFGLFSRRFSGKVALFASIIGIVAGAIYFPGPSFARGNLLWAFLIAFIVPAVISIIFGQHGKRFDFKQLNKNIISFDR